MDSDPTPRDGSYYQPVTTDGNAQANQEELRKAEEAMPFVDGVIKWFDSAIGATNQLDVVRIEAKRRDVSIEVAVEAYDMVREILELKRGEFESLKMTFDK